MGAALAKQIPALIEGFLQVAQPLGGVIDLARVVLHLAAELVLSIDHLANAGEDVGVIHTTQPRGRPMSIEFPLSLKCVDESH
jgi:hypothetical protein